MKQYLSLLLISFFALYCSQENASQTEAAAQPSPTEQTPTVQVASQQPSQEDQARLARECEEYFKEWEKLNDAKAGYFEKNILAKALANPALPEENRKFLVALNAYLKQSVEEMSKELAPQQLLFPVFKLRENELGIIGLPLLDSRQQDYSDISAEKAMLKRHAVRLNVAPQTETNLVFHKAIADSLIKALGSSVYTFTTQKPVESRFTNFGTYSGACLEYYHYQLDTKPYSSTDKVLFGSKYKLELNFKNTPAIDAIIVKQDKPQCADCPESTEHTKTFAELKGVDGLYFAYADTFPVNDKLDTPSRMLVMKMGGKIVYLWYKEVDLFGCSCL